MLNLIDDSFLFRSGLKLWFRRLSEKFIEVLLVTLHTLKKNVFVYTPIFFGVITHM